MDEDREEHGLDTIRVFDSEQLGYINSVELETALRCMPGSAQMKEFELRHILRLADPDGDGKIDIQGAGTSLCKSLDSFIYLFLLKLQVIFLNFLRRSCFDRTQLFRQRLSKKSVKAYATMPKGSLGNTQ